MLEDKIIKEINKMKNLSQNKDKSEEELREQATKRLERKEIVDGLTFCLKEEKSFATELLNKYLDEKTLESSAEKDTLRHLIDLEILLERIKSKLNLEYEKPDSSIPVQLIQQTTELTNQIMEIKDKLGLSSKVEQQTVLEEWNKLKAKALAYYRDSAGCNVVRCPECKKLFMILKDMRSCVTANLPWFRKTVLYNKPLYEMYAKNRVTLKEMSEIFGVSEDYIIYIYEKVYLNDKQDNV